MDCIGNRKWKKPCKTDTKIPSLGLLVEESRTRFVDANECFVAWRHWYIEASLGDISKPITTKLNEYAAGTGRRGENSRELLSRIGHPKTHGALTSGMREFMEKYSFLFCP